MRIDDLAGPRVKQDTTERALDDLAWLGLDWFGEPILQSRRLDLYRDAMRRLASRGLVFPCALSRREIDAAHQAPHAAAPGERAESRFDPGLRPAEIPRVFSDDDITSNWRFIAPPGAVTFVDLFAGPQSHEPAATVGDFVVWTRDREPAYQLASIVDDHNLGVSHIVRGDDLLDSAARQLLLARALGLSPEPQFMHLPLVVGADGRRLAKRHGDTRLSHYRDLGVTPERIVALLARMSGVPGEHEAMSAAEFADRFDPATMPRQNSVFTAGDDAWLLAGR